MPAGHASRARSTVHIAYIICVVAVAARRTWVFIGGTGTTRTVMASCTGSDGTTTHSCACTGKAHLTRLAVIQVADSFKWIVASGRAWDWRLVSRAVVANGAIIAFR